MHLDVRTLGMDCPSSCSARSCSVLLQTCGIIPEVNAFGLPLFIYSCLQRSSSFQLLHHSPASPGSPLCSHSPALLTGDPHWVQDAIRWLEIIRNINHKEHLDVALQTSVCEIHGGKLSGYQWLKKKVFSLPLTVKRKFDLFSHFQLV